MIDLASIEHRLVSAVLDDEERTEKYGVWEYAQEMGVRGHYFSSKVARRTWDAISFLKSHGIPVDARNVHDHLTEKKKVADEDILLSDLVNAIGAANGRWLVGQFIHGARERLARALLQTSVKAEELDLHVLQTKLRDLIFWGANDTLSVLQQISVQEILTNPYPEPPGLLSYEDDPPILATNQILLIGGTRGIGKTLTCLNVGLCLSCGKAAFGKWKPYAPVRVLYVHAEAELPYFVQQQLLKLTGDKDRFSDQDLSLSGKHFIICIGSELVNGELLNIQNAEHRAALARTVQKFQADLLILDPLYWISGGVDENKAQDMQSIGQSLRQLSALAECAVMVTVHFNKSGRIAGSYAIEGFASAVIELHPLSRIEGYGPDDLALYLTKTRNGISRDGRDSWRVILNRDTLWFDMKPDVPPRLEDIRTPKPGRKREYPVSAIRDILASEGDLSYGTLSRRLQQEAQCSSASAERMIAEAVRRGEIGKAGKLYTSSVPF